MVRIARLDRRVSNRIDRQSGFTVIELLVVVVVIAILAAIAIPTFVGQRTQAHDSAAVTLVRNALTSLQTAWVSRAGDYTRVTAAELAELDSSVNWVQESGDLVTTSPPWISGGLHAGAGRQEVAYYIESPTTLDLATRSESGNTYGIQIDTMSLGNTGYVKVRVVDGSGKIGW